MHRHLPLRLQLHVCKFVDLRSLLTMRACSRQYLDIVKNALEKKLYDIVQPFFPHPEPFISCLNSINAFIGGDGALSFLLRDEHIVVDTLLVSVGYKDWRYLLHHLTFAQNAREVPCPIISPHASADWAPMHGVETVITMRTPKGDIHIYRTQSFQSDPLTPIARAWSTLHTSYVNGLYFGTGSPSLLFSHRALLSDGDPDDTYTTLLYIGRGFDIRLTARAWADIRDPSRPCPAHRWACTAQARSFKDDGALTCRFNPFLTAPLHTTAIWRLDCRPCGGTCLMDGLGILREWQLFDSL